MDKSKWLLEHSGFPAPLQLVNERISEQQVIYIIMIWFLNVRQQKMEHNNNIFLNVQMY